MSDLQDTYAAYEKWCREVLTKSIDDMMSKMCDAETARQFERAERAEAALERIDREFDGDPEQVNAIIKLWREGR